MSGVVRTSTFSLFFLLPHHKNTQSKPAVTIFQPRPVAYYLMHNTKLNKRERTQRLRIEYLGWLKGKIFMQFRNTSRDNARCDLFEDSGRVFPPGRDEVTSRTYFDRLKGVGIHESNHYTTTIQSQNPPQFLPNSMKIGNFRIGITQFTWEIFFAWGLGFCSEVFRFRVLERPETWEGKQGL